jgi:hypothetical protein
MIIDERRMELEGDVMRGCGDRVFWGLDCGDICRTCQDVKAHSHQLKHAKGD